LPDVAEPLVDFLLLPIVSPQVTASETI
jgi:hypothetical protein